MNRVRTGLLVAAAALAGLPAIAQAQDAGQPQREYRGGGWRGGQSDGARDRGAFRNAAPAAGAAGQVQAPATERAPRAGGFAHGYTGQTHPDARPRWNGAGNQAAQPNAAAPVQADQGRRGFAGNRNDRQQGWNGRDDRRWDGNDRRGIDNRQGWRGNDNRGDNRGWDNRAGWRGNDARSAWNNRGGTFRNDWRNDRRYDWRSYRNQNRSLFRSRYVAPRGYNYGYRAFSIGFRLDPFFYAPSYWLNDPWQYRLPAVDGAYRWVRYYDDVLLVDIATGEVVDVIHDFFW